MARPSQNPQIRITEILDTAEHLFTIKGYFGTTISDIAKEMSVTQGMFYYYFKSKEEILEALLNRQMSSFISEVKNMAYSSATPSEKIGFMISIVLHGVCHQGAVFLNTIYDEQNLHIKDRLARRVKLLLTPWGLKIIEQGNASQDFKVPHPQTSLNFILLVMDFLMDTLYEKVPSDILALRLRMAEALIEKTLGLQEGRISISL
jgi:AcrR family transcriptional regulator